MRIHLCIYVLMILHESPHRLLYKTEKTYLIVAYLSDQLDKLLFSVPIFIVYCELIKITTLFIKIYKKLRKSFEKFSSISTKS